LIDALVFDEPYVAAAAYGDIVAADLLGAATVYLKNTV
jgi:hypothetical protein